MNKNQTIKETKNPDTLIMMSIVANGDVRYEDLKLMLNQDKYEIVALPPECYENMGELASGYPKAVAVARDITKGDFVDNAKAFQIPLVATDVFKQLMKLVAA